MRIARAAGRGDIGPCDQHSWARNGSAFDRIAQRHIGVRPVRSHITHGGKPRQQRHVSPVGAPERVFGRRGLEQRVFPVHVTAACQMGVKVDEARKQGCWTQVNDLRTARDWQGCADRGNAVALDSNHRGHQRVAAAPVDQARGLDQNDRGSGCRVGGWHTNQQRRCQQKSERAC